DEGQSRVWEPGIAEALAGHQTVQAADGVMRVVVPLFHGDQVAGAICVSQPLDDVLAVLGDLRRLLLLATAIGVVGAGLAGLVLARAMSNPLRELATAAAHLARGEFDRTLRVRVRSRDEIGQLGDSFRRMSAQLQRTLDDLARQSEERRAILTTLADGVLAVDAGGRLLFANPVVADLLHVDEGIIADEDVRALLARALNTGQSQRQELSITGRAVEVLVTPLAEGDSAPAGAVAVLHDVTGFRELEDLKTRFVSDVSHELRTPLTSIKGMAETLRAGAVDDARVRDRFLGTIEAEADRLTALVNDLLVLSRADSHMLELRLDDVDLAALARESAERLAPQAASRGVRVEVAATGPAVARVDPYRIQQVLVNLLDNAIKYSPAGGVVTVTVAPEEAGLCVSVRDEGPGIPPAAQPHVFQRFYRADEARSRRFTGGAAHASTGSGLGLSIAQALVHAHGGRIWLESAESVGTTVSFFLPGS
ncbi:MAG: cell wall metabolism sensor histidine kinase WalK, partial [Chloroflexi bacterium]|nr:cell wall metabolism sensor histidine kinase WalK [Chloroflexota bacterium]